MPAASDSSDYIHGYTDAEAERLVAQAEFLAPWVFDGLDFSGLRRLLEVGVGVGAETRLLRARWPGLHVVGLDISAAQLQHARRVLGADLAAGTVELMRASATALPLVSASADGCFVCWLLEHVPDPVAVLRECGRVVAPGGSIFVTEVYNASFSIEPRQPALDHYFALLSEAQRRAGGHPNIGAALGLYAARAGLEVVRHHFVGVIGDARDRSARTALLRYFRTLLESVEPQLRANGLVNEQQLADVAAAWDAVERNDDTVFGYTIAKLEARVPSARSLPSPIA